MKKLSIFLLVAFCLPACDVWDIQPQPFPYQTPQPTYTPRVWTATPIVLSPVLSIVPTLTISQETTFTVSPMETATPTLTPTNAAPATLSKPVQLEILGCDTGFDVTHGMGEVTNAYVVVKNVDANDLPNVCALLRAGDEGREHPDKKSCVENLPKQNQVALKLTVDSTYRTDTVIQVDVMSNETVLLRADQQSCRDINLFGGAPADIGVIKPISP